jgi:hypothetical protein
MPWEKLPNGWTQDSVDKFWDSLVGDVKHKVTKCIDKMEDKFDDPGAFCASLADKVEGKSWRSDRTAEVAQKVAARYLKTRTDNG